MTLPAERLAQRHGVMTDNRMSTNSTVRTRSERVATIQVDTLWSNIWDQISQRATLLRVGIALSAAILIAVALKAWNPPFSYHQGYIPPRSIVARVYFEMIDKSKTESLQSTDFATSRRNQESDSSLARNDEFFRADNRTTRCVEQILADKRSRTKLIAPRRLGSDSIGPGR
jgi:hypothetical protein